MSMDELIIEAVKHAQAGRWQNAHDIVQDIDNPNAYWIHAYLHRVEGDDSNAAYWYRRAGRAMPTTGTTQELEDLANELLSSNP